MEPTLPKSDSTTSLSSLISIGNESKNSGPSTERCIICLGDDMPILSTLENKSCKCLYHYHENCLKEWFLIGITFQKRELGIDSLYTVRIFHLKI